LSSFSAKQQQGAPLTPTEEALIVEAQALLPLGVDLPEDFSDAAGEVYVYSLSHTLRLLVILTFWLLALVLQCAHAERRFTQHRSLAWRACGTGSYQGYNKAVHPYQWLLCYRHD
jgi:hypothetical protein